MRSHEAHEHEHQIDEHEQPARAAPLHHPRRTADAAPSTGPIQRRVTASANSFGEAVNTGLHVQARGDLQGPDVHRIAAHGVASGASSLPHAAAIQASFGHHDVSGVRAHVGGAAAEASAAIGAQAYATGDSVAFSSTPDLHLAAHEAAHVVQQRAGVRLSGGVGAAGDEYERHADAVADLVVQGKSAQSLLDQYAHRGAAGGAAIQKQSREHGGGTAGHGPEAHAPTAAEMCAAPVDQLHPQTLQHEMLELARGRARELGTAVPAALVSDVMADVQGMLDDNRAGASVHGATLEGTYVNYDWTINANIERRVIGDCGSTTGRGTTGRTGTATTRSTSGEDVTSRTSSFQGGNTAPPEGGRTGTASTQTTTSNTRRAGVSGESHGRTTSANVTMEVDGRIYEYIVTWTIQTEISHHAGWANLATAYASLFRGAYEPVPWVERRTTSIGTRREDDEHAATRRPGGARPRRPTRIE